ncbi:14054_t:CDS:1, partial [Cetraspora pellucida]
FKRKSIQDRVLIKNPTEDNPYMEEVKNLSIQKEIQNMDMNETCLQEQVTEEITSDYDMDSKTDT